MCAHYYFIECNKCTVYMFVRFSKCLDTYNEPEFIYFILVSSLFINTVHAQLNISTSTPTPCYGDVVTLVCHHPEVASNPGRYFSTGPLWRENGVVITPSTGVYLQADTSEDLTNTTLTIGITVGHFRNKSFNYSCLLVLAENGQPSGSQTSENVTVDPVGVWVYYIRICTVFFIPYN